MAIMEDIDSSRSAKHICTAACGGCDMMGLCCEEQIRQRKTTLEAAFKRRLQAETVPAIKVLSGNPLHYRARIALDGGAFHKRHSNECVRVSNCLVATDEVNEYLSRLYNGLIPCATGRTIVFGDKHLISESNVGIKGVVVGQEANIAMPRNAGHSLKHTRLVSREPPLSRIEPMPSGGCTAVLALDTALGKREICFDVRAFFQSNIEMLLQTIPLVCGGIRGENALDMYAGCGTFSTFLMDNFQCVTLVEKDALSIAYAEANIKGGKHKSYALSGAKWVKYLLPRMGNIHFDAVIADPPRSGMEREVLDWLSNSDVPVIKSLSCDANTHARDVAALVSGGYHIEEIVMLDFYPQTHRIESLVTLRRR